MAPVSREKEAKLTHARLLEMLHYDPLTGEFIWRVSRKGFIRQGESAGWVDPKSGYRRVCLEGEIYMGHRLAWFYVKGVWPENKIDHEDGNKSRNVFANLRPATDAEQMQNKAPRPSSKSGLLGVAWDRSRGKWKATIMVGGVSHFLGHFTDAVQAAEAYARGKAKFHTFSPTVRPPNESVRPG